MLSGGYYNLVGFPVRYGVYGNSLMASAARVCGRAGYTPPAYGGWFAYGGFGYGRFGIFRYGRRGGLGRTMHAMMKHAQLVAGACFQRGAAGGATGAAGSKQPGGNGNTQRAGGDKTTTKADGSKDADKSKKKKKTDEQRVKELKDKLEGLRSAAITNIKKKGYGDKEATRIFDALKEKIAANPKDKQPEATLNGAIGDLPNRNGKFKNAKNQSVQGSFQRQFGKWWAHWIGGKGKPEAEALATKILAKPAKGRGRLDYVKVKKTGKTEKVRGEEYQKYTIEDGEGRMGSRLKSRKVELYKKGDNWYRLRRGRMRRIRGKLDFDEKTGILSFRGKNYRWVTKDKYKDANAIRVAEIMDKAVGRTSGSGTNAKTKGKPGGTTVSAAKTSLENLLKKNGTPVATVTADGDTLRIKLAGKDNDERGRNADFIRNKILNNKDAFNKIFKGKNIKLEVYTDKVKGPNADEAANVLKRYAVRQINGVRISSNKVDANALKKRILDHLSKRNPKVDVKGFKGAVITVYCLKGAVTPAVKKDVEAALKDKLGVNHSVRLKLDEITPDALNKIKAANKKARDSNSPKYQTLRKTLKLAYQKFNGVTNRANLVIKIDDRVDALLFPKNGMPLTLDQAIKVAKKELAKKGLELVKKVKATKGRRAHRSALRAYSRWYKKAKGLLSDPAKDKLDPKKAFAKKTRVKSKRPRRRLQRRVIVNTALILKKGKNIKTSNGVTYVEYRRKAYLIRSNKIVKKWDRIPSSAARRTAVAGQGGGTSLPPGVPSGTKMVANQSGTAIYKAPNGQFYDQNGNRVYKKNDGLYYYGNGQRV